MATTEEVSSLVQRFYEARAKSPMTKMDKTNLGMGLVLRCLAEAERPLSAAEISRYMSVSTARVAVLLRVMEEKALIVKSADSSDARKILVSLSEGGKDHIRRVRTEFSELITEIVNKVGIERMEQFLEIYTEINDIVTEKMAEKCKQNKI